MKKKIFILSILCLIGCGTIKNVDTLTENNNVYSNSMVNLYEKMFTAQQFDSICTAEKLPKDLTKWHNSTYQDFETYQIFNDYIYIKSLGVKQEIFRVEKKDNGYKITKRVTK